MHAGSAAHNQGFSLIVRRNSSLRRTERWCAYAVIAFVSVLIAVSFAAFGAWFILPFAGLELAGLYLAFRSIEQRDGDYECVTIAGDRLTVERRVRGRVDRFECNRLWAQVVVRNYLGGCQLALRSQGREIEFGTYLSDVARQEAARRLRDQLRVGR